ncbi:MAG: histidine kinase [Kibdelosporangium sp.]
MTVSPRSPVTYRWLLALLCACFVIDVLAALNNGRTTWVALIGAALLASCAMLATRRPVEGAVSGALVLVFSTVFIRATAGRPASVGFGDLLLSEMVAGVVLVVLVVWRCRVTVAAVCTTMLVGAALLAVFFRTGFSASPAMLRSLQVGLLLLVASVVIGGYLRGTSSRRTDTELGLLVRRQWPLAAALAVMLFLDIQIGGGTTRILALGGAVFAAVCAFFAPRAPVSLTLAATAGIALSPLALFLATDILPGRGPGQPLVLAEVAASMALIAFVIRWGQPWPAGLSTAGLVVANLLALQLRATASSRYANDGLAEVGVYLGLLFVVAVATGVYFKARDRERNQSVKSAVTGAQQSERMALARELHDVVAHHVTGIVVQAQAARLVSEKDPQVAVRALAKIETSGVEALKAMRFLVGSMRGAKPAGTSQATEQATMDLQADLHTVVEHFGGPPVHLDLRFASDSVPQELGRSVLRLVQESLTNVGKHALGAKSVQVRIVAKDSELHVQVVDDGVAQRADPVGGSGGYGLVGMRERVELLGGRFTAGLADPVGWRVEAWLPLSEEAL